MKSPKAQKFKSILDECAKRVEEGSEEMCTEELFDLLVRDMNLRYR